MPDLYAAVWDNSGGPAWVARHRMTSDQYQTAFDQFTHDGYRLISVSGYSVDGQARYAALWDKSAGPAWEAHHGMTSAQYQDTFNKLQQAGFRLRLVNGYTIGNQDFYAAIWDKTGGPAWQARHRLTASQYQATFDQLQHQGYRLTWVSTYAVGGNDLYAAIWQQTGGGAWEAHHRMSKTAFQANSVALAARGLALRCVDACTSGGSDLYAALWEAPASPGAVAHHGMTSGTYQQFFDQSVGQGLRPVVVAGYDGEEPVDAVLIFTMQKQQQPNWCWAATSVSIAHYYQPSSTWTQCGMADAQLGRNDCCGAGATGPCNVYGFLDQALSTSGHLDHATGSTTALADVTTEVAAGRPLGIRIAWSGGGAHFVAATGVEEGNLVFVSDCGSGTRSVVAYNTLVTAYRGSGTWTHSYFTKA